MLEKFLLEKKRYLIFRWLLSVCVPRVSLKSSSTLSFLHDSQHLDTPGNYKAMTQYYIKYRHCPLQNNTFLGTPRRSTQSLRADDLNVMKVKCFFGFPLFYGLSRLFIWTFFLCFRRFAIWGHKKQKSFNFSLSRSENSFLYSVSGIRRNTLSNR